mmetsp:Transcript_17564/g.21532  ORF Transcript_17564/g.21532 Transcript_17564/m.21532 type:complete len:133 (-) Transcript_17564:146-544(-)
MSCANPWTDDFIAPEYHANDSHFVTLPTLMHHLQSVMGDGITSAKVGEVFFELLKDKKQNPSEDDDLEELAPCVFREDDLRERFCNIVRRVCIDEFEDSCCGTTTNIADNREVTTETISCVLERFLSHGEHE